jgi:hypothetical protein
MTIARLRSHGHPAIRATHPSSWELVPETELTERGTCIVGVGTELIEGSLDHLVGPLAIELAVAGCSVTVDALGNPERAPGDRGLVVRTSRARVPGTLATEATAGSAALDRALIDALADPRAVLDVTIRRRPRRADGRAHVVVGRVTETTATRVAAEVAAADAVVVEQAGLLDHERRPGEALAVLDGGGRVLVLATSEVAGHSIPHLLDGRPDVALETFGLSPAMSVGAVLGGAGPLVVHGRIGNRDDRAWLAHTIAAGGRVVAEVGEADLVAVVDELPVDATVVLLLDAGRPGPLLVRDPGALVQAGRENLIGVARRLGAADDERDALVDATGLVAGLLAAGVSRTTITRALAAQPGWSRNRAYQAVLAADERSR